MPRNKKNNSREWYEPLPAPYQNQYDMYGRQLEYQRQLDYERKMREQQMAPTVPYNQLYNMLPQNMTTIPTAYTLTTNSGGSAIVKAEYLVTDPGAVAQLMRPEQLALPTSITAPDYKEEPLKWLDRRVGEMCKIGSLR